MYIQSNYIYTYIQNIFIISQSAYGREALSGQFSMAAKYISATDND